MIPWGVPVLSEEELRRLVSQPRLPIAHGLSLLDTTALAPIAFLGSFALAEPTLESPFHPFYAIWS